MKNICLTNGSLRGKAASSLVFLNYINCRLAYTEFNKDIINVRTKVKESCPENNLKTISRADAIIMVFPLLPTASLGLWCACWKTFTCKQKAVATTKLTRFILSKTAASPSRKSWVNLSGWWKTFVGDCLLTGGSPYAWEADRLTQRQWKLPCWICSIKGLFQQSFRISKLAIQGKRTTLSSIPSYPYASCNG